MQRTIVIGFILVLLAGGAGALWLLNSSPVEPPVASSAADQAPAGEAATVLPSAPASAGQRNDAVIVDARVVPRRSAELSFSIDNVPVHEILVQEGDVVDENTPLMRLDPRELQLRVEQAEAALQRAKADYEGLIEGPTPAQIAQAQAQVSQAQARLRQSLGNVTAEDIAAAEARLEEARARLAELEAGPRPEEIEVARAALDRARSNLDQARSRLSSAKTTARSRMEQAANRLRDAQDTYSEIYWATREIEDQDRGSLEYLEMRNREQAAARAVDNAEEELEQARVVYEEAQQAETAGLQAGEAEVRDAQARLNLLLAGADPDELATARAAVADATAALTRLRGEARAGAVEAARADVADAQARLDDLLAEPLESDLARAEATIQELEVRLQQQQLEAERATLLSPIAGVVAEVNVDIGEVPGGLPPIVIADVSEWQLETDNLTDLNVVRIREGDPAVITFYALPDLELTGQVAQIKPLSQSDQGETIYTVTIRFDEQNENLRWNMISQVAINTYVSRSGASR